MSSPGEFTTWLRGFVDALDGAPMTAKQVEHIRAELARVVDTPAPAPQIQFVRAVHGRARLSGAVRQPVIPHPWPDIIPNPRWIDPGPVWDPYKITCTAPGARS